MFTGENLIKVRKTFMPPGGWQDVVTLSDVRNVTSQM